MNTNLNTALMDLTRAIQEAFLGSIEANVIEAAGKELIDCWNDHHTEKINTETEMDFWEQRRDNSQGAIRRLTGACPCGEDH